MIEQSQIAELSPSFSIEVADVDDKRPPQVLICLHGIRDNAAWGTASETISGFVENHVEVAPISYEQLESYSFILGWKRKKIQDDVIDQINFIKKSYPYSELSIICHSNGTKVLSEIINRLQFRFEWVFLCGSVCKLSDVNSLRNVNRRPINDAATKDWWPIWAELLRPDLYQATGVYGFHKFPVRERMFAYGHSDAVDKAHIERWVLPVLATGRINLTDVYDIGFKKFLPRYGRRLLILLILIVILLYYIFHH